AGIGLLLTFIGLRNVGVIVGDPATLVRMGTLDHRAVFLLLGIIVAAVLMRRHNPLAFLASIFSVTALAWTMGYTKPPERLVRARRLARGLRGRRPEPHTWKASRGFAWAAGRAAPRW